MSKSNLRLIPTLVFLGASLALLGGCGGESTSASGDSGSSTGTLSLGVTDAPVDGASAVWVSFSGVAIQPENGGERIEWHFDAPREINLLDLQGTASEALIIDETVPAGRYTWIRLLDPQAEIAFEETGDARYEMFIPSGDQAGLRFQSGFTVAAGGAVSYTIDFDLRKAVVRRAAGAPGGEYILRPAHRLVDNTQVGNIEGTVDQATASAADCVPAAYLYAGADASPDDLGSDNEPLTSTGIELTSTDGNGADQYTFTMGFVPAGDYTVAWTCEADMDEPDTDDELAFETSANVTVTAGETTQVDL